MNFLVILVGSRNPTCLSTETNLLYILSILGMLCVSYHCGYCTPGVLYILLQVLCTRCALCIITGIVYQVRCVQLVNGQSLYCIWVSRDPECSTQLSQCADITVSESLNSNPSHRDLASPSSVRSSPNQAIQVFFTCVFYVFSMCFYVVCLLHGCHLMLRMCVCM